jgi:galactose oxidase
MNGNVRRQFRSVSARGLRSSSTARMAALMAFTLLVVIAGLQPNIVRAIHGAAGVTSHAGVAPATPFQTDPSVVGQWSPVSAWPTVPIHISVLPDGRVLFWGRDKTINGDDVVGFCNTYVWSPNYATIDPYDGPISTIPNNTTNLFCSGHSFTPDGRLLVTGGHGHPTFNHVGVPDTNIFDYRTNTWTRGPNMNAGRWYPFNVTLATGETLVVSGNYWDGTFVNGDWTKPNIVNNKVPQVWTAQNTWQTLSSINQLSQPIYPWLHLLPDGRVFLSGYTQQSYYLDVRNQVWQAGPLSSQIFRDTGTGILYDMGRVLIVGGGDPSSTSVSEAINLTESTPFFRAAGQLAFPRRQMTGVLLPTGDVMVFGGTSAGGAFNNVSGAVYNPELWNHSSETWSIMAASPSRIPRLYHSTAILLPDARVFVGGGGLPAASGEIANGEVCTDSADTLNCRTSGHKDVEVFSPPYLFRAGGLPAPRPTITSAPSSVAYGQSFTVGVGTVNAQSIQKVTWIRLPSMTHSFSQDQRINFMAFTPSADGLSLTVTAPPNSKKCPPGHYMLFLINGRGTPSVARIIKIG